MGPQRKFNPDSNVTQAAKFKRFLRRASDSVSFQIFPSSRNWAQTFTQLEIHERSGFERNQATLARI